jgi:hypothetical protein
MPGATPRPVFALFEELSVRTGLLLDRVATGALAGADPGADPGAGAVLLGPPKNVL